MRPAVSSGDDLCLLDGAHTVGEEREQGLRLTAVATHCLPACLQAPLVSGVELHAMMYAEQYTVLCMHSLVPPCANYCTYVYTCKTFKFTHARRER